ncbi:MAG: N-acetyl sugar amidotransferase [Methylococcaceae bacterium]|nr:N-acetyl sugar amidotransferase [Methylococcaceae bacterium]
MDKAIRCRRCVMDTTDPDIMLDAEGICSHCRKVELTRNTPPFCLSPAEKKLVLKKKISIMKSRNDGNKYDCVIGLSGGVDSSYVALLVKKFGLNPLAVHLDNGWNSGIAVQNIERICKALHIDLLTHVIDWEEFRSLQLAFLRASTPDSEIPTDHAIHAVLQRQAAKFGCRTIVIGTNFNTEAVLPVAWSYGHLDWKYIRNVHRKFSGIPIRTFPRLPYSRWFYYAFIKHIRYFPILDYIDYDKEAAKVKLISEIGWQDYGGKHEESRFTKFFQQYILPVKFGFDKRKAHLSSLIMARMMTRDQALQILAQLPYDEKKLELDKRFVINKLGISEEEFAQIMAAPPKKFRDYPSYENSWYFKNLRFLYRVFLKKYHRS